LKQLFKNEIRENLWEKLEEITPDSWDEFSDLFSRHVVAAKPQKPKAENRPIKQQTIKSKLQIINWFNLKKLMFE